MLSGESCYLEGYLLHRGGDAHHHAQEGVLGDGPLSFVGKHCVAGGDGSGKGGWKQWHASVRTRNQCCRAHHQGGIAHEGMKREGAEGGMGAYDRRTRRRACQRNPQSERARVGMRLQQPGQLCRRQRRSKPRNNTGLLLQPHVCACTRGWEAVNAVSGAHCALLFGVNGEGGV